MALRRQTPTLSVLCRERLWVVVDFKRCYRNSLDDDEYCHTYKHSIQSIRQGRGVHPPWDHDAFPPVSDSPYFLKFSQFYLFPTNFLIFIRQNFSWLVFLVIDQKFRNSPLFSLFQYISPLFRKNYYFPPALTHFPPCLDKFTCFLHTLRVFRLPPTLYFDHDAFMHHPMHVLDAPASVSNRKMGLLSFTWDSNGQALADP